MEGEEECDEGRRVQLKGGRIGGEIVTDLLYGAKDHNDCQGKR